MDDNVITITTKFKVGDVVWYGLASDVKYKFCIIRIMVSIFDTSGGIEIQYAGFTENGSYIEAFEESLRVIYG